MHTPSSLAILFSLLVASTAAQSCVAPTSLSFTSSGGKLAANSVNLDVKGANWFGMEYNLAPEGLNRNTLAFYIDFLATNGFNGLRIPFAVEMVVNPGLMPRNINYGVNPGLAGKTALQVLDAIFDECASRGILVVLDQHRLALNEEFPELWYNSQYSEETVKNSWSTLVARYSGYWNFLGVDLMNEPHGAASWGTGNLGNDWRLAAQRIGNDIIARNPGFRGLILVEGVNDNPTCQDGNFAGFWWGGNFQPVNCAQVTLSNQQKLVYSPHVYGPSVYDHTYFSASNFPANMPAIWDSHYGFLPGLTGQGIIFGEWGGPLVGRDATLQDALVTYWVSKGMTSNFYWALNPNPGGDTDGILGDDWTSPNAPKLDLLNTLVANPTTFSESASTVCINGKASSTTPAPPPVDTPSSQPTASNPAVTAPVDSTQQPSSDEQLAPGVSKPTASNPAASQPTTSNPAASQPTASNPAVTTPVDSTQQPGNADDDNNNSSASTVTFSAALIALVVLALTL